MTERSIDKQLFHEIGTKIPEKINLHGACLDGNIYASTMPGPLGHAYYMMTENGLCSTSKDFWNFPWEVNIHAKLPEQVISRMLLTSYNSDFHLNKKYVSSRTLLEDGELMKYLALRNFELHDPQGVMHLMNNFPRSSVGVAIRKADDPVYDAWISVRGLWNS